MVICWFDIPHGPIQFNLLKKSAVPVGVRSV